MSSARNDRNSVQFGPARSSLEYKLDRLEEEVRQEIKNETVTTTQNITNYVDESITNITGNAELLVGTVVTYNSALSTGTVTIDTATVDFYNASSVRLEVDDVIILSANEDYPDPFCVGLISRNGFPLGYDTYGFVIPSQIPGLPTRVDPFSNINNFLRPQVVGTTFYAPNFNTLYYEDWDTGSSGSIPLPIAVNDGGSFSVNGNVICISDTKNSGGLTYIYDGAAWNASTFRSGMWWPDPQGGVTYGVFNTDTSTPTGGPWLVEVDTAGVVTSTSISALGSFNQAQGLCVGGGHVVVFGTSGNIYIDGALYPYTYGVPGAVYLGGLGFQNGMTTAIYGDYLYLVYTSTNTNPCSFQWNTGPSSRRFGVARVDLTNPLLTATTIPDIFSSTGAYFDGEAIGVRSVLALDDDKMVLIADIAWSFYDPVYYSGIAGTGYDDRAVYHVVDFSASTITSIAPNYPELIPGWDGGSWSASAPDYTEGPRSVIAAPTGTVGEMAVLYTVFRYTNTGSNFVGSYPQLLAGEVI
jgi:hypothetical protein